MHHTCPQQYCSLTPPRLNLPAPPPLPLQYGGYYTPGAPAVSIPQGHGDLCDVPADLVFPLGRMTFQGTSVSVPGDVTGVLTHRYGETFMIPR